MVVTPAGKIEPLDVSEIEDAKRAIIKPPNLPISTTN